MGRSLLIFLFTTLCLHLNAQQKEKVEKLVAEGIILHDNRLFDSAIAKYDSALILDKNNLHASAEKALSLFASARFNETVEICKHAIAAHAQGKELSTLYSIYGNAMDEMNDPKKAIAIFEAGIKQFPDYYPLYFNKGITLIRIGKTKEAIENFQKTISIAPNYASAHIALARMLELSNERIPAILAYGRALILEPDSKRSAENLESMENLMKENIKQVKEKNISITLDPSKQKKNKANQENDFEATDLILTLAAADDFSEKNKNKSIVEKFIKKIESVCTSLKEEQLNKSGFYWNYYAPYFIGLYDNNLLNTFGYITHASSDDILIATWIQLHQKEINAFYDWTDNYNWQHE